MNNDKHTAIDLESFRLAKELNECFRLLEGKSKDKLELAAALEKRKSKYIQKSRHIHNHQKAWEN